MNVKRSILLRVRIAFLMSFLFALAVVVRMGQIQFVEGERWTTLAEEIGLQFRTVKAMRGSIYSDNGRLLATSLPFYRVAFDPSISEEKVFNDGIDSLAYLISKYFGDRSTDYYARKIKKERQSNRRYLVINNQQVNYQDKKDRL